MQAVHDAGDAGNGAAFSSASFLAATLWDLALKHERTIILENDLLQMERKPKPRLAFKRRADLCLNHGLILFGPIAVI